MGLVLFSTLILGLFVGSFLNVLIFRIPRNLPFVKGRSFCPHCNHTLAWYDLIPLVSYAFLHGRCRYCKHRISLYYGVGEVLTFFVFFMTTLFWFNNLPSAPPSLSSLFELAFLLYIMASFIVIFFIDATHAVIPTQISFPAIGITLLYRVVMLQWGAVPFILSGVAAAIFFTGIIVVTRGRGMGEGDVVLALLLGLFLGFPGILIALYAAFIVGAVYAVVLIALKKKKFFGDTIPFGPFLILGAVVSFFLEKQLIALYFQSFRF